MLHDFGYPDLIQYKCLTKEFTLSITSYNCQIICPKNPNIAAFLAFNVG
jgi:hypothetical protein